MTWCLYEICWVHGLGSNSTHLSLQNDNRNVDTKLDTTNNKKQDTVYNSVNGARDYTQTFKNTGNIAGVTKKTKSDYLEITALNA